MHAQVPGLARSVRLCLVTVTPRKQVGWGDETWGRILSRHRSLLLRKEKIKEMASTPRQGQDLSALEDWAEASHSPVASKESFLK